MARKRGWRINCSLIYILPDIRKVSLDRSNQRRCKGSKRKVGRRCSKFTYIEGAHVHQPSNSTPRSPQDSATPNGEVILLIMSNTIAHPIPENQVDPRLRSREPPWEDREERRGGGKKKRDRTSVFVDAATMTIYLRLRFKAEVDIGQRQRIAERQRTTMHDNYNCI